MTTATEMIFDEISETEIPQEVIIFDSELEAISYYTARGYLSEDIIYLSKKAKLK